MSNSFLQFSKSAFCNMSMIAMFAANSTIAAAITYDAADQFSLLSNPNPPWSYGWRSSVGGAFNAFTHQASYASGGLRGWDGNDSDGSALFPYILLNTTGAPLLFSTGDTFPIGLSAHPSRSGQLADLRWIAPSAGSYDVSAIFSDVPGRNAATVGLFIQHNGLTLDSDNLSASVTSFSYTDTLTLADGDILDFLVASNGDYGFDQTGIRVTITQRSMTPVGDGGTTHTLLGISLLALGISAKRSVHVSNCS